MGLSHTPHFGSIKEIDPVYVRNIVIPPKKMGNVSKLVRPKPEANLSLTSHNDRYPDMSAQQGWYGSRQIKH